jgi:hypothetical protein
MAAGFVGSCPGLSRLVMGSGNDRSTGCSGQSASTLSLWARTGSRTHLASGPVHMAGASLSL